MRAIFFSVFLLYFSDIRNESNGNFVLGVFFSSAKFRLLLAILTFLFHSRLKLNFEKIFYQ